MRKSKNQNRGFEAAVQERDMAINRDEFLLGFSDMARLIASGDEAEILSTVRDLLTRPTQISRDYEIGALDAALVAFTPLGASDYSDLARLSC